MIPLAHLTSARAPVKWSMPPADPSVFPNGVPLSGGCGLPLIAPLLSIVRVYAFVHLVPLRRPCRLSQQCPSRRSPQQRSSRCPTEQRVRGFDFRPIRLICSCRSSKSSRRI